MAGKKKRISFEEGFAALEALVTKMESEMPLEESMAAYEEGVRLHQALLAQLDASEKRMRILSAEDDE
jgi:exodeoxyribonuclease VII small subunit